MAKGRRSDGRERVPLAAAPTYQRPRSEMSVALERAGGGRQGARALRRRSARAISARRWRLAEWALASQTGALAGYSGERETITLPVLGGSSTPPPAGYSCLSKFMAGDGWSTNHRGEHCCEQSIGYMDSVSRKKRRPVLHEINSKLDRSIELRRLPSHASGLVWSVHGVCGHTPRLSPYALQLNEVNPASRPVNHCLFSGDMLPLALVELGPPIIIRPTPRI